MRTLVVLGTLLFVLVACGDSDGPNAQGPAESAPAASATAAESTPETSAPAPNPEADLEQAYRTYVNAFLTGDGATSYALLSKRCQRLTPLSEFAGISEAAAELYGPVKYTINSVEIDGNRGTLDAEYPVAALNQGGGSVWVREGGQWRTDKCD